MSTKVTPLKAEFQDPAIVIANLAEDKECITQMLVVWVDMTGTYHLDRTPMTWQDCAAFEAMVRQETFDIYNEEPEDEDEPGPETA